MLGYSRVSSLSAFSNISAGFNNEQQFRAMFNIPDLVDGNVLSTRLIPYISYPNGRWFLSIEYGYIILVIAQ